MPFGATKKGNSQQGMSMLNRVHNANTGQAQKAAAGIPRAENASLASLFYKPTLCGHNNLARGIFKQVEII